MKLKPLCDCKEDKVVTGQFDGEMIWRYKTPHIDRIVNRVGCSREEAVDIYEQNSD